MFPIDNIPAGIRWISNFIWGRYYIEIVRDALLRRRGLAGHMVQSRDDRIHRRDLLLDRVAHHAPHAACDVKTMAQIFNHCQRALLRKEFSQIRRDRRLALALILPPTLQLLLLGFALSADVTNIKLGAVDDSRTPQSRELVAILSESRSFRLVSYYTSVDQLGDCHRPQQGRCRSCNSVRLRQRLAAGPHNHGAVPLECDERKHGGHQPRLRGGCDSIL